MFHNQDIQDIEVDVGWRFKIRSTTEQTQLEYVYCETAPKQKMAPEQLMTEIEHIDTPVELIRKAIQNGSNMKKRNL